MNSLELSGRGVVEDGSSLRPQHASFTHRLVSDIVGAVQVRGEGQNARGILLCHIVCRLACSTHPLHVLLLETLEPLPAVFSIITENK